MAPGRRDQRGSKREEEPKDQPDQHSRLIRDGAL